MYRRAFSVGRKASEWPLSRQAVSLLFADLHPADVTVTELVDDSAALNPALARPIGGVAVAVIAVVVSVRGVVRIGVAVAISVASAQRQPGCDAEANTVAAPTPATPVIAVASVVVAAVVPVACGTSAHPSPRELRSAHP